MGNKKKRNLSELESEFMPKDKKPVKKGDSVFTKVKDYFQPDKSLNVKKKVPLTFNVGVALILFFFYFSIMITGGPSQPIIFVLAVPTLYILARYISLERKHYDVEQRQS